MWLVFISIFCSTRLYLIKLSLVLRESVLWLILNSWSIFSIFSLLFSNCLLFLVTQCSSVYYVLLSNLECLNKYDYFRYIGIYQFTRPSLIIRDPELIKELTVKDFDHFTDHRAFGNTEIEPLWSSNLFALQGKKMFKYYFKSYARLDLIMIFLLFWCPIDDINCCSTSS